MEIDLSNIEVISAGKFEIESGKPIPPNPRKKYPFDEMEVGDSFFVPVVKDVKKTKSTVANSARAFGKRGGQRFSVRDDGDGVRVWRVA